MNSQWGEQEDPLAGDVINSYNDGPNDAGSVMGPFYEIESSSPAALLTPGDSMTHTQRVYHIKGEVSELEIIINQIFNTSISQIEKVFETKK